MKNLIFLSIVFIFFIACSFQPTAKLDGLGDGKYSQVTYEDISGWEKEEFEKSFAVFKKTCMKTKHRRLYQQVCERADESRDARRFFEENFTPFMALSDNSLATGYFEPVLEGSYEKSLQFPYPIYGVPSDLVRIEILDRYEHYNNDPLRGRVVEGKVIPYYSREEINDGALKIEPICYVKDKIERFFLHIQGSGQISLDNGERLYVGYADQNGFPYVSIGSQMIKRGLLDKEEISLESIQDFLQDNPSICDDILELNPSYIFFEERLKGATGSLGVVLEGGRSIAVDKTKIPLGLPVFISTHEPLYGSEYERLVFAHDTGGAIRGEARIDIFFGSGSRAREQAGKMKDEVKLWILVPNDYLSGSGVE